jgi:general secretion pathway protein D
MAYVLAQAFGTQSPQLLNPFFGGFFGGFGNQGRDSRRDRRIRRRLDSQNQRSDAGSGSRIAAAPAAGFRPEEPEPSRFADASGQQLPPELQRLAQFIYDPYFNQRRNQPDATTGRTSGGTYVNLLQLRGNVLVTPERNTNSLIITTSPENEQAVRELIADLDVEVKQVLLEALVVEVTLDRNRRFGIDYLFNELRNKIEGIFPVFPGVGPLGPGLTSGLRWTIVRGDFRAILTADDRIRILSTPSIFTANNQEAEIEVTDSIPYLAGTTIGFGGQSTSTVDFIDVGLILNVTPRITADGMVAVDVYQEDSNFVDFRDVGNDAEAPITTQRVTDTSVTLRDGDTLVLSGLQKRLRSNNKSKIPILGDLPLIGGLFRSTSRREQRTELIVFLTPRVVNNANEARSLTQQELQRIRKEAPDAKPRTPAPERREPEC